MEHIREMEEKLNQQQAIVGQLQQAIKYFESNQADFQALQDYYFSDQYMQDFDAAERGELDKTPCGVLSEDAIYHLITDRQQVAIELLELATKLLKEG